MIVPLSAAAASPMRAMAPALRVRLTRSMPSLLELAAVVTAIVALLPWFDDVARIGPGRDQRFLDRGIAVVGLPESALPEVCAAAALADASVREAFCGRRAPGGFDARSFPALTVALTRKVERAAQAFVVPLRQAEARADSLRRQAEAGDAGLRDNAAAVAAVEAEIAPFVARYRMSPGGAAGPEPLRCTAGWLAASTGRQAGAALSGPAAEQSARANALLLVAAALDG
ncbi:MAG: hypothetical protein M3Z29_11545, partial [Pseudomonadota bacterium]|nr:hypothetical protein [Pseudomonadota bacterium]